MRIIGYEAAGSTFVGEDSWGMNPEPDVPVSTLTTVANYSKYGEPVTVEAPEGVETLPKLNQRS